MKVYPVLKNSSTGRVNIQKEHLEKSGIKLGETVEVKSRKGMIVIRRINDQT